MADKPDLLLPNSGRAYDPSIAQDHTGIQFESRLKPVEQRRKDPRYDAGLLMRKPAWHKCPGCGSVERYRFLAESDPMGDGLIQIVCLCGHESPVMMLGQPQVNDYLAARLGLSVPDKATQLALDLDLEME